MNLVKKHFGEKARKTAHKQLAEKIKNYKQIAKNIQSEGHEDSYKSLLGWIKRYEEHVGRDYESDLWTSVQETNLNLLTEIDPKINNSLYTTLALGDPFAVKNIVENLGDEVEVNNKYPLAKDFWDWAEDPERNAQEPPLLTVKVDGVEMPLALEDNVLKQMLGDKGTGLMDCWIEKSDLYFAPKTWPYWRTNPQGFVRVSENITKSPWLDVLTADKDNSEVAIKEALAFAEEALEAVNRLQSLIIKEIENVRLLLNKIQEPYVEDELDNQLYKAMETKSQNYQNLLENL